MFKWLRTWLRKKHVILFCAIVVIASGIYGYKTFGKQQADVKYQIQPAQKGMFIASLSGTGQVASEDQVDVKPKVSGNIVSIKVKNGQEVKKGDVIAQLDATDGQKAVRDAVQSVKDAKVNLDSAKLALTKLQAPPSAAQELSAQSSVNAAQRVLDTLNEPPDPFAVQQAENRVAQAEQNAKMSADGVTPQVVRDAYDSAVNTLITTAQTAFDSLKDADDVLGVDNSISNLSYVNLLSVLDKSQKDQADAQYLIAKPAVTDAKSMVDALSLTGEDPQNIDAALGKLQDALIKESRLLSSVTDALNATLTSSSFSQSSLDSLKSTIQSDRNSVLSKQSALNSLDQSIESAKTSYVNSGMSVQEAQNALTKLEQPADPKDIAAAQEKLDQAKQALADLHTGPTDVDVEVQQNSVTSRQLALTSAYNNLTDARNTLSDYTIVAPFDGVIASVSPKVGDSASPSTAVATILTTNQVADLSLNEVDAAKVKVGQKATLTFDAIDGLTIAGEVAEVSTLGTVSQGVVNYDVKIAFGTQDDRVRPDMTVNAAIVTETQPDAIMVPNAAVKSSGAQSYVEMLDPNTTATTTDGYLTGTPIRKTVQVGSANDTDTVITGGLNEGDDVIVQTIQPSATTAAAPAAGGSSALRIPGVTGGGGGARAFTGGGGGRFGG